MTTADQELQQLRQLRLAQGAVASGKFGSSRMLVVKRGYVWITQEGRSDDFWLHAGDALIVAPGRLVVIEAALDSELSLDNGPKKGALEWLCSSALTLLRMLTRTGAHQGGR